jgi:hypothetical protein
MRKWKYVPSPAIDEFMRAAYEKQRLGDRLALTAVSRKLGWPRYAIAKRGAELGVTRIKERVWSAAQLRPRVRRNPVGSGGATRFQHLGKAEAAVPGGSFQRVKSRAVRSV